MPSVVLEVATRSPPDEWPTLSLVLEKVVDGYAREYGLSAGRVIPLTGSHAWLSQETDSIRVCDLCLPYPIPPDHTRCAEEDEGRPREPVSCQDASPRTRADDEGDPVAPSVRASSAARDYVFVFYHMNGVQRAPARPPGQPASLALGNCDAVPLYTVMETANEDEERGDGPGAGGGSSARLPCCTSLSLPHASLDGLWESLYYGENLEASVALKAELLQYVVTALQFSRCDVDANVITWNRLLLFYGPPGTGKTSLAKALAQKLALRLQSGTFARARLIEVNAHSLFSRWFSESGKQVTQLFEGIRQIAADASCLVCVLLDEVESLVAARQAAMHGNEPSDAIRVVNAVLTQIDALQRSRNVLVLTTSNLTGAVDPAFADRADMKVLVGPPGYEARRAMLEASVTELVKKNLLSLDGYASTDAHGGGDGVPPGTTPNEGEPSLREAIAVLAHVSRGLSGRMLKKLPFLAYGLCQASQHGAFVGTAVPPRESTCGEPLNGMPAGGSSVGCSAAVPHVQTYVRFLRKSILRALREEENKNPPGRQTDTTHQAPAKAARTDND